MVTVLTKRLAAIAAGVFGPERAGHRRPVDSKRAQLDQSSPPFSDPTSSADSSTTVWIWRFTLASEGFLVLAVLLFRAIGAFGGLGLSGKGLVALTLGFLFTKGRSSSSATTVSTIRPIGRSSAKREGALSP